VSAWEIVTIVVAVVAIVLAASNYFRLRQVLSEMGQRGYSVYRGEDADIAERPNEDDRDAPIPKRPLRGRLPD
jgi:hypothetical protein